MTGCVRDWAASLQTPPPACRKFLPSFAEEQLPAFKKLRGSRRAVRRKFPSPPRIFCNHICNHICNHR